MFFEASASNLRFSTLRVVALCALASANTLGRGNSLNCEVRSFLSPIPLSFLGHASNPNKSDIYLAGLWQYIPDLRPGLCCAQAYDSYG